MTEEERRRIGLIVWDGVPEAEKAISHAREKMVEAKNKLVSEMSGDKPDHMLDLIGDLVSRYNVAISDIEKVYYYHSAAISEQFYWDD